jgi:hypothetical protein
MRAAGDLDRPIHEPCSAITTASRSKPLTTRSDGGIVEFSSTVATRNPLHIDRCGAHESAVPEHDSFLADVLSADDGVPCDDRHREEPSARFDVGTSPHPRSTDIGAPTPSRRVGARNPSTTRIVMNRPSWGTSMDFVDRGDDRPEPISIARCRELLGDEADTLTDQDVELIRRHAETMAQVVVQMYVESRRIPG